jgi:hypothetical protein
MSRDPESGGGDDDGDDDAAMMRAAGLCIALHDAHWPALSRVNQ